MTLAGVILNLEVSCLLNYRNILSFKAGSPAKKSKAAAPPSDDESEEDSD